MPAAAPKSEDDRSAKSEPEGSTPEPPAEPSRPTVDVKPAPSPSQPQEKPFGQLGVKEDRPAVASTGSVRERRKRGAPVVDDENSAPAQRKPTNSQQLEPLEDYANRVLSHIFGITVDPHVMSSPQDHRLVFLPNLNEELNNAGEPLKLSTQNLDQAIIEAGSSWPHDRPLMDYLLPCWKRAVKAASSAKVAPGPRAEVLEEAQRLCMSNCLFALTMPVLYG